MPNDPGPKLQTKRRRTIGSSKSGSEAGFGGLVVADASPERDVLDSALRPSIGCARLRNTEPCTQTFVPSIDMHRFTSWRVTKRGRTCL